MYIFDITGQLVNLGNKDVRFWRYGPGGEFEASVYATGLDMAEGAAEYTLHQGTMAECRDFMAGLARRLNVLKVHASSTPNEKPTKPPKTDDDLPF